MLKCPNCKYKTKYLIEYHCHIMISDHVTNKYEAMIDSVMGDKNA